MAIALGATVDVLGPQNRRRTVELTNFFFAPTGPTEREHTLAANELVIGVNIPVRGLNNAAYEVRQKQATDWPIVQCAVVSTLVGGVPARSRPALNAML